MRLESNLPNNREVFNPTTPLTAPTPIQEVLLETESEQVKQNKIEEVRANIVEKSNNDSLENKERIIKFENLDGTITDVDLEKIEVVPIYKEDKLKEFEIFSGLHKLGSVSVDHYKDKTTISLTQIFGKPAEPKENIFSSLRKKTMRLLDLEQDSVSVVPPTVNSGKGIGTEAYKKINDWLVENDDSVLVSDGPRTKGAERLWKSLERKGLAKRVKNKGGFGNEYLFNRPEKESK